MNIAIISHPTFPIPPETYGGIQRGVYDLSLGLAYRGHRVLLFCTKNSTIEHSNIQKIYLAEYGLGEVKNNSNIINVLNNLKTELKRHKNKIDIINLRWESEEAQEICRKIGKPLVLSISCIMSENDQKKLYIQNVTYTSHTLTHSANLPFIPNIIASNYGISTNSIISNSIDENVLDLPDKFAVCIAGIQRGKGQKTAIKIANTSKIPIVIVGMPGDATESNEYFEKYIKPLIDSSNVIYFGEANESQKNELFRRAYFSIVTSGIEDQGFKEPFGRVIAESLMNGCPVLGYIGGGSIIEQVIQGVDGYLFDSIDETSNLIQKIKFLDRKQIAVDARKRLSSDKFIDTMNQILTDAHSK